MRSMREFLADESGATAIEYALIASGIAMAILVSLNALGSGISAFFDTAKSKL